MEDKKIIDLGEGLSTLNNLDISESSTNSDIKIDGTYILARVKGPMFFPDTPSRNQRYYPRQLWENVCNDPGLRQKMKDRNLYSTISHDIPYGDATLAEGKYSHFITDLYIDKNNQGICEFYILGTPSGRILNTHLRAGCRMYSSTRADGAFTNETYNGMPVVDPSTYRFFGMDIVTEPGFLQANPALLESLREDYDKVGLKYAVDCMKSDSHSLNETTSRLSSSPIILNTRKTNMSENSAILESLTKEATDARSKMNEALQENAKLQADLTILREENRRMTEEFQNYKADMKRLAVYEALGDPSSIEAVFDQVNDLKDKLDAVVSSKEKLEAELGTPEEIRQVLSAFEDMASSKSAFEKEFGTEEDVRAAFDNAKEVLDRLNNFEQTVGSMEEIDAALSSAEELCSACSQMEAELGSPDEIREAFTRSMKLLNAYRELGTPNQIQEAFKISEDVTKRIVENRRKQQAVKIANDIGAQPKAVYEMLRRGMSESFIRQNLNNTSNLKKGSTTQAIRESLTNRKTLGNRLASVFFRG